jgi:type I restriction enzyme S subunit
MKIERYEGYKDSDITWLGSIPTNWNLKRLQDLSHEIGDGLHGTPKYVDSSPYYFINGNNLSNGRIQIKDSAKCISKDEYQQYKIKLDSNSILLSINGTIGNLAFYGGELIALGKSAAYIRIKPNFNKIFIYYFLQSEVINTFFNTTFIGTTIRNLSLRTIRTTIIPVPSLEEQAAIARYLDTKTAQIDRKIDLLTQKATLYGNLKQSLINETVTRGLDKTVPMKDSGIEWISEVPKHWEIHRIKDYTYVKGRIGWQGLRSSDFLDQGEFYCVTGTDLVNGSIDWSNCYFVSQDRYEQDKYIQLKMRDLLITKDGTIGKIAVIHELPLRGTLNSGLFVTRPLRKKYLNDFMYWVLNSSLFKNYIDLTKGGSTVQHLYQNVFDRFWYACPPCTEQQDIVNYLSTKTAQIDQVIQAINTQIAKFIELRKTLINDVVTGKIKVV